MVPGVFGNWTGFKGFDFPTEQRFLVDLVESSWKMTGWIFDGLFDNGCYGGVLECVIIKKYY